MKARVFPMVALFSNVKEGMASKKGVFKKMDKSPKNYNNSEAVAMQSHSCT